jgi:hypothetical protein
MSARGWVPLRMFQSPSQPPRINVACYRAATVCSQSLQDFFAQPAGRFRPILLKKSGLRLVHRLRL